MFPAAPGLQVPPPPGPVHADPGGFGGFSLDERLKAFETNLIAWALKESGGNKSKAAELLMIKRSTLGDRIARCGLS
jgi:DNA-binding NtrC family response regulator